VQLSKWNEYFCTDTEILATNVNRLLDVADDDRSRGEAEDLIVDGVEVEAPLQKGREVPGRSRGIDRRSDLGAYFIVERGIM
jgi:hypothetical protein